MEAGVFLEGGGGGLGEFNCVYVIIHLSYYSEYPKNDYLFKNEIKDDMSCTPLQFSLLHFLYSSSTYILFSTFASHYIYVKITLMSVNAKKIFLFWNSLSIPISSPSN